MTTPNVHLEKKAEDAKPEDLEAGCNVLLHAMLKMANA